MIYIHFTPDGHLRKWSHEPFDGGVAYGEVGGGWRPIESAPFNTPVEIKAGSMTFLARLMPDASEDENEQSCDQWVAHIEGEHPPCWSGGACWSSNENDGRSLQPEAWRHIGAASAAPELLAALKALLSELEHKGGDGWMTGNVHGDDYDRARAAITKAEG